MGSTTSHSNQLPSLTRLVTAAVLSVGVMACGADEPELLPGADQVFYGALVFDGSAEALTDDPMVIQVGNGRILGVHSYSPEGSLLEEITEAGIEAVDATGKYIVPGFINAHGHAGSAFNPDHGITYDEWVSSQLRRYARFGITTVNSLGGATFEAIPYRDASRGEGGLDHARLMVAGEVVAASTSSEALSMVERNHEMGVDWIKARVDDNLGTTAKMPLTASESVIRRAHELGYSTAFHLYYLDDAKDLLRAGVDLVAHSIRDADVDQELIDLFVESEKCYVPTLAREVSTFIYSSRPDFFDDPFLMNDVDSAQVVSVSSPSHRESVAASPAAAAYRDGLVVASRNLKALVDGGIPVAMGTDTGPVGRFQGYFEHMEMSMMEAAGLTPVQVLQSATGTAAWCLGREDIGILEEGRRADLIVLREDPTQAIGNTRFIDGVWIGGQLIPGSTKGM